MIFKIIITIILLVIVYELNEILEYLTQFKIELTKDIKNTLGINFAKTNSKLDEIVKEK